MNLVVARVRDVKIAARIDGDPSWNRELRAHRRPITAIFGTGDRGDNAIRTNLVNPVVPCIRDIDIVVIAYGHTSRTVELCRCGRTAVAVLVALLTRAGDGSDDVFSTRLGQLADAVMAPVRDINVAVCVHGHADRPVESRTRRRPAIADIFFVWFFEETESPPPYRRWW